MFSGLAEAYKEQAQNDGHQVEVLNLRDLKFDLVLRNGFRGAQPLEEDLQMAQQKILWADHLLWVYPNWWGGVPALLKGFIDRTLLPGFAFKYKKGVGYPEKLLTGKTADILLTLDTPTWFYRWFLGAPGLKLMKSAILGFCGIKVKRTMLVGPIRNSSEKERTQWLAKAKAYAQGV